MPIRSIKKLEIKCDNCQKIIATGQSSTDFVSMADQEANFTEIFCVDCRKLPVEENNSSK